MERYDENNNSNRGCNLRVLNLLDRRGLAPLNFNSGRSRGTNGSDDNDAIVSRKLSYRKLPQQHFLDLSVLKLDGSLFDVNVGRNATVAELKVAIEEVFAALPGETHGSIHASFYQTHVHQPITYKKTFKTPYCSLQKLVIRIKSSNHQEKQQNAVNYNDKDENQEDNSISHHYEEEEEIPLPEFQLAHFLRGWLSYT